MKTIYYAATVLAAFGLLAVTSCHKDAPVDPKIEFSANLPELTVGSMGGTLTLEFTSAAAWTARMSQAWCSVSPSEGDPGQCSVTVTIGENMSYETRTVDLKIISGTLEETLTITQIQNDAIVIAQDEYTVPSAGDTLEFVLNTNVDFDVEISSDCDWITYLEPTKALEEVPVAFWVAPREDESNDPREAVITFVSGEIRQSVTVRQVGHQEPSVLGITHVSGTFTVPEISGGNFIGGTVSWGDGQTEDYRSGLVHNYENAGQAYTVTVDAPGADKFVIDVITGVTELDLREF